MIESTAKSLNLAKDNKIFWARPLIIELEKKKEHSAILWVIRIVRGYVQNASYTDRLTWLKWLDEIEAISLKDKYNDIEYLSQKAKSIFNAPSARNTYLTMISHIYFGECVFRSNQYDRYIRNLWEILNLINDDFENGKSPIYYKIIEGYKEWLENQENNKSHL